MNVVLNRIVVVDSDWRFDNLCCSRLQSQSELYHVSWWYYTLVIDLIGQLRGDVIGRRSVKPWCYWLWRLVISNWCVFSHYDDDDADYDDYDGDGDGDDDHNDDDDDDQGGDG